MPATAGVKPRTTMKRSRKMVATCVLSNRLRRSLLAWSSSSTLAVSCALTVCSSSFIDWISSLEVSSSSLVDCISSLTDCSSSLADFNSSSAVSYSSTVDCNCSRNSTSSRSSWFRRAAALRRRRLGRLPSPGEQVAPASLNTTMNSRSASRAGSGSTVRVIGWRAAVQLDLDALAFDGLAGRQRLAQRGTQFQAQAAPRHRHQVARRHAGRRLQIPAGAAGEMQHGALGVHHDEGRSVAFQNAIVGGLRRGGPADRGVAPARRRRRHVPAGHRKRRELQRQARRIAALEDAVPLVDRREQLAVPRHHFRAAEQQIASRAPARSGTPG